MSDEIEIVEVEDEGELATGEALGILTEEQREELVKTLKDEYDAAASELDARNQKLIKWRKNMEAASSDAPKNHPFKNASNVVVPVTQTLTQTLAAKIKGSFDAREPLWSVRCQRHDETSQNMYKVVEKYLNMLAVSPNDLDMPAVLNELIEETVLAGGSFPKVGYEIHGWKVRDQDGGGEKEVISHDGPIVAIYPLERVKYRRGVSKISRLPWISTDDALTEVEIRDRASRGIYDPVAVDKMLTSKRTSPTETEEQGQQAETFDTGETMALFDVSEVLVYYDVAGDGIPVDMVLTVHFESGTILKEQYNSLGRRFLLNAVYVYRPRSLTGRGTGQMTESGQSEVTSIHNLRNDNMKIANMRMIAVKRGFGQKREVYPGALWEMDNPKEDVQPIQLGEVYPSSLQAEGQSLQYTQRAIGLSETQMGFADSTLGTRDTARGQAMRLQTGDTILSNVMEGLKATVGQIGMLVWMQCVANKERVIAREKAAMRLSEEDLGLLAAALEMEVSDVPMRIAFTVKTSDGDQTYEQQRMNLMTMTQIYAQFAKETIPLAIQLYGPQGMQMQQAAPELWAYLGRIMVGSSKLVEDIFKFFGIYDTMNYVPNSAKLDKMLDMMQGMAQAFQNPPQLGAPQQPPVGPMGQPGMGGPGGMGNNAGLGGNNMGYGGRM